jgi:hypothetical protein
MIKESIALAGPQADYYGRLLNDKVPQDIEITRLAKTPTGAVIAALARDRLESGENDDVLSLTPLYLKESTAKAFKGRAGIDKR